MAHAPDVFPGSPPPPPADAPPLLPLAPIPVISAGRAAANLRLTVRVWCTFVFSLCAGMLGVGLWLTPDPRGIETHTQLHMEPCAFFHATGYPCPTCGCTTAVSHFAHGHLLASLATQPFGFSLALLAAILLPLTLFGMFTGRWVGPSMFKVGWYWRSWSLGLVAILLLAWGYKAIVVQWDI